MDLLERYLGAVAALLPRAQRDDIIAELRDLLMNRFEEKEAELGRPLSAAEQEALIRANGHPLVVAGRYGSQGPLIGPAVYPLYVMALKIALGIGAVVTLVVMIGAGVTHPERAAQAVVRGIYDYVGLVLTLVGVLTTAGWLVERGVFRLNFLENWRPSSLPPALPPVPPLHLGSRGRGAGGEGWLLRDKSKFESLFELVVTVWALSWWLGWANLPIDLSGSSLMQIVPSPVWDAIRWPVTGLFLVQIATNLADLLLSGEVRVRAALSLASNLAFLVLIAVLWRAAPLFELRTDAPASRAAELASMVEVFNLSTQLALVAAVIIGAYGVIRDAWRLIRA